MTGMDGGAMLVESGQVVQGVGTAAPDSALRGCSAGWPEVMPPEARMDPGDSGALRPRKLESLGSEIPVDRRRGSGVSSDKTYRAFGLFDPRRVVPGDPHHVGRHAREEDMPKHWVAAFTPGRRGLLALTLVTLGLAGFAAPARAQVNTATLEVVVNDTTNLPL